MQLKEKNNPFKLFIMKFFLLKLCVFAFLLAFPGIVVAQQKTIVIDEILEANSEPLKVKLGTQWMGKIWKIKFGDFTVTDSKMGWTKTSYKSNLFNTKSESKTTQKFSFTLSNKTGNTANVNAANDIETKVLQETELFKNFYIGGNEILLDSRNFTALININNDTATIWTLYTNVTQGSDVEEGGSAFLTDGKRKILIISTSSNRNGNDSRMFPALGYEFIENEEALGALQYFGGGALGTNKNVVWLLNSLNADMQLILASAITALIQLKN